MTLIGMHNAKLLDLITLEDVLEVYRSKIDPTSPSRAKVSVHLRAQKEKPKKASKDATDAFDAILRTANDQLSDEHSGWRADVGADGDAEPQANTVVEHWRKRLAHSEDVSPAQVDELVAAFEHLIDKYPSTFDNEGKLAHGTVLIEDPKAFKAKLEVAKEPRPLVEWGDLPTPKL
jgi:insulysin